MPSESPLLAAQTEKPHHYTYLKEFRTQQCPLFVQHKCTQHRPFTCFNWHFLNQRRRRPVKKRDGLFSYSPDVYCSKYDETTGTCPDGDECPFLHRTAGDTERRYHLRYYKTSACVHETDSKGHCTKNGPHCAFAHGAQDLRVPVYDVRELQAMDSQKEVNVNETPLGSSLEKDRTLNDDPRWNDTAYVLANYKTEQCKRPPRLCRQGYACPQFHNSRDKRRGPTRFKYRSTPCPNVKHGDEWCDPSQCESGENCGYCHTRTEQQFHPEIYKSTKCNDMVQNGYCPRGPFCAFAHVEHEITAQRDLLSTYENNLAAYMSNALEGDNGRKKSIDENMHGDEDKTSNNGSITVENSNKLPSGTTGTNGSMAGKSAPLGVLLLSTSVSSQIEPAFRSRAESLPASHLLYARAPGSEREDSQFKARKQVPSGADMLSKSVGDKGKFMHEMMANLSLAGSGTDVSAVNFVRSNSVSSASGRTGINYPSFMSPNAAPFYPAGETVESVIGNALDEDFPSGELNASLDRDLAKAIMENDTFGGSVNAGFGGNNYMTVASSVPVTIPSSVYQHATLGNFPHVRSSSPTSPLGIYPSQFPSASNNAELNRNFLSQPPPAISQFNQAVFPEFNTLSPGSNVIPQTTQFAVNGLNMQQPTAPRLWEENRVASDVSRNLSQTYELWRKEMDDAVLRVKIAEEEKLLALKQRDEALIELNKLKREVDLLRGNSYLRRLNPVGSTELEHLPLQQLKHFECVLGQDLESLKRLIEKAETACVLCHERRRGSSLIPCNHFMLCDACAVKTGECPYCHVKMSRRPLQSQ